MMRNGVPRGRRVLTGWLIAALVALLGIGKLSPAVAQPADFTWNIWNHNGSTMYLEWIGRQRNIYYLHPRQGLLSRGVRQGTLLFTGTRNEFEYSGTAYIFSLCGPQPYEVTGSLSSDLNIIRLTGRAPIVDRNCTITGTRDDVLDFSAIQNENCGCECPGEIPVADIDTFVNSGEATSCPYLYAFSEEAGEWKGYGKVIHIAQGRHRETVETVPLKETALRFRLREEEPENAFIDHVELRIETEDGAIYALKPDNRKLAHRDGRYQFIAAYKKADFTFRLPNFVERKDVLSSTLSIAGYYERIGSNRSTQCYARVATAQR